MPSKVYDAVQVGYGPVGQTNAALLGKLGRSVAVFEQHADLYALPRAGHIDHEIMRIFQSVGAAEAVIGDLQPCERYSWRNQHGETLFELETSQPGISGWASDYLMYQPYVENALDAAARRWPAVEVHHGWQAEAIRQSDDGVEVDFVRGHQEGNGSYRLSGERRTVRGRYLIGADGANSTVRELCGLHMEDLGFREQWLVVDFREKRPLSFEFDNGQICDPARPLCLFQLGKRHRRFEFMVLPGEDGATLAQDDSVWRLVAPWVGPEDVDLIRSTTYTFRSANARQWRSGRALLIGDAAHLMPPFLGQGMCSGIRDAANLAWKLDLVLRGEVAETLLDSYEIERKPHVSGIIAQAVALGRISCTIDPEEAARRDSAFLSGLAPPPPPTLQIGPGILQRRPSAAVAPLVGRLAPQGQIGTHDGPVLADNLVGGGWTLISTQDVASALSSRSHAICAALGVRLLNFGADGLVDQNGTYRRFLKEAGVLAILVRPDFYVFGGITEIVNADALFADLADQLEGAGGSDSSGASP